MVQNRDPSNMNNSTPLDIVNLPNMVTHMYNMPINKDDLRQISLVITKHDGSTYYFRIMKTEDGFSSYYNLVYSQPQIPQQQPIQPPLQQTPQYNP